MDTILITGGAGFIGSAITRALIADGIGVTVVDDLSTGVRLNVPPEAHFIGADVADRDAMRAAFGSREHDAVLHLAAQVSNIVSHRDPWADFRTNVGGTLNVIEQVVAHRIPRVLYASSMALYGDPAALPVSETAVLRPRSPYGVSKLAAEHLIHNAGERSDVHGFAVTSLRMFNVYGPGQSLTNMYQGVLSVFVANLLAGDPITLYGTGRQTRDFVYVDDVVDAWVRALRSDARDQRINVGSGVERSIGQLIDDVLAAFGRERESYPIHVEPELPGDQRAIRAVIGRARELLGWSPRTPFEAGLRATIEWARSTWKGG